MTDFCDGKLVDVSAFSDLDGHPFRIRLAQPAPGAPTPFAATAGPLQFNGTFWASCDAWAANIDGALGTYAGARITWFGHVGTLACHRETAAHNRARGFDLCGIRLDDGRTIDMNAWSTQEADPALRRTYIAVAASLRRFFGTVLTTWYNSAHRDHIHLDDLTAVAPIRTAMGSDTTLIQSICREFVDPTIVIDGAWGPRTEAAYRQLLIQFGLLCHAPRRSVDHALTLLNHIVANGLTGEIAHTYPTDPGVFADVGECSPFFAEIDWMFTSGTSLGYPNPYGDTGTPPLYKPFDDVRRQEIAAFLYRLAGSPTVATTPHFTDVVPGQAFFTEIQWMWESGASLGYPGTHGPEFRPLSTMSRQEMAAFLHRLAGAPAVAATPHFSDVGTGHRFFDAIQWMWESGTSLGSPGPGGTSRYLPTDVVSRQAMAAFLHRRET